MGLGLDGKILFLLGSGKTLREIIIEGDYNLKAYIFKNLDEITKMIIVWRKFDENNPKQAFIATKP